MLQAGEQQYLKLRMGEAIRHLYRAAGLTQEDLADDVGVSQSTISDWVNGKSVPSAFEVIAIDVACGAEPGHILGMLNLLDPDLPREAFLLAVPPPGEDRKVTLKIEVQVSLEDARQLLSGQKSAPAI